MPVSSPDGPPDPEEAVALLYRDEHLVAVAKPGGMCVHRTAGAEGLPLLQVVRRRLGQRVYPVHRLDRATAGVVIFGRSSEAAARLCDLFATRQVQKVYWAVVRGYTEAQGTVDYPLARSPGKQPRPAITHYRRLAWVSLPFPVGRYATARYSLIEARPHTGRHHQIRRHCAHMAHPVVGDTVHGDGRHNRFFREHFGLHRLLLMARLVRFHHPYLDRQMVIEAPLEPPLAACLGRLWPDGLPTLACADESI